jgi:hypothetical protein
MWLKERKNRKAVHHRPEACYVRVRNPGAGDGFWPINGKRQAIYAKASLTQYDRTAAARKLTEP